MIKIFEDGTENLETLSNLDADADQILSPKSRLHITNKRSYMPSDILSTQDCSPQNSFISPNK